MLTTSLLHLFNRDLNKLKLEVESYKIESNLWIVDKNISNSAGNLCLHLVGNLRHFIGNQLGNNGYVRVREEEFAQKDIPRTTLLAMIDATIADVNHALNTITPAQLEDDYPIVVFTDKMKTGFFLIHLSGHLSYHLGQINYHRRLLDN